MQDKRRTVLLLLLSLLVIGGISLFFTVQMNQIIHSNTIHTITELAKHDEAAIQPFVENRWSALDGIYGRLESASATPSPRSRSS